MNNQTAIKASLPNYLTVKQFCQRHPAFRIGGIRFQIFNETINGLKASGAVVRNGRKVLINEEKYFDWLETGQGCQSPRMGG